MTSPGGQYIAEDPGLLSDRAKDFIRTTSHRCTVDTGLTGRRLREEIVRVYGEPNDAIVDLLKVLQSRYGGLSYHSGFFQSEVRCAPVCEPEDPDEELEILYAVQTGGSAGASVKVSGEVEVGFDSAGIIEFENLDSLIECDAIFAAADALAAKRHVYLNAGAIVNAIGRLRDADALNLELVSKAGGSHSYWLESESVMVFITSVWAEMELGMPPILRVWARVNKDMDEVVSLLADMIEA